MSFLLQKRRGGGNSKRNLGNPGRSSNSFRRRSAAAGQVQQMVHRPATTRQQPQQIVSPMVNQNQQQKNQNQELQDGVISMAEVMEDLRVLEHQQKESETLLTNQKRLKKQKTEILASEEQALASSKYQNGETRAAVEKHRQILGDKTREILALEGRRAGGSDNLKRVDFKLSSALATGERIRSYRHKIDMTMLNLKNVAEMLNKQRQKGEADLKNSEMRRDNTRHKENLLVKSIANFRSKANSLANDVIRIRESIENYKTDRANAQHMEASTKFRVESIVAEIRSDRKRHEEVVKEVHERLAVFKAGESEVREKMEENRSNSTGVENEIVAEQEWAKRCQIDEDLKSTGDLFDFSKLLDRCENEEGCVVNEMVVMEERKRDLERMLEETDRKKSDIIAVREKTVEISKQVEEGRAVERKRKSIHTELLEAVRKDREEVENLKDSADELTAQKECTKKEAADKLARHTKLIKTEEKAVSIQKQRIVDKGKEIEVTKVELSSARRTLQTNVEQARKEADVAEAASILIQSHREELQKRNAKDEAAIEFADIEGQHNAIQSAAKTEIAEVLAEYPNLSSLLTSDYAPKVDLALQVDEALTTLRDECNRRILAARQNRQQGIDELRRKRDVERAERKFEKERIKAMRRAQELKEKEEADAEVRLRAEEKVAEQKRLNAEAERKAEALERRKRAEKKRITVLEAVEAEKALMQEEEKEDEEESKYATLATMESDDEDTRNSAKDDCKDILSGEPSTEMTIDDAVTPEKPTRKKSVTFSLDEDTYYTQCSNGTSVVSKRKTKRRTFDEEIEDDNEQSKASTKRNSRSSSRKGAESLSRCKSIASRSTSKATSSNRNSSKNSRSSRGPIAKSQESIFGDDDVDREPVEPERSSSLKSDGGRRRSRSTSRSTSKATTSNSKSRKKSKSSQDPIAKSQESLFDDEVIDRETVEAEPSLSIKSDIARRRNRSTSRSTSKATTSKSKSHKKSKSSQDPIAKSQESLFDDEIIDRETVEAEPSLSIKSDIACRRNRSTSRDTSRSTSDQTKKRRSRSNSADEKRTSRSDNDRTSRPVKSEKRPKNMRPVDASSSKSRKSSEESRHSTKPSSSSSSRGRSTLKSGSRSRTSSTKDKVERESRSHRMKSDRASPPSLKKNRADSLENDKRRKNSSRESVGKVEALKKTKSVIEKTQKPRTKESDEFDFDFSTQSKDITTSTSKNKSNRKPSRRRVAENDSKQAKEKETDRTSTQLSQVSGISSNERQRKPLSSSSSHRPRRLKHRSNLKAKQQKMNLTQVDDDVDFSFA